MTGWDENFLQKAIDTCTNDSGMITDCPLFNVVDEGKATSCSLDKKLSERVFNMLLSENVEGPLSELPGGMEVDSGAQPLPSPFAPVPTLVYAPAEPTQPSAPSPPGPVFKEQVPDEAAQAPGHDSYTETTAPPALPAATMAPAGDKSYFSTELVTKGAVVSKILWEEDVTTVTEYCDTTTTVAPTATAGQQQRRSAHLQRHAHGRRF